MPSLSCYDITYPKAVRDREADLIAARRRRVEPAINDTRPRVGLALSGGGIRSATFCLGVIQALSEHGLLRRFDYLSTVSGGGYIGSFLGALVCRTGLRVGDRIVALRIDEETLACKEKDHLLKALAEHPDPTLVLEVKRGGIAMAVRLRLGEQGSERRHLLEALGLDVSVTDDGLQVQRVKEGRSIADVEDQLKDPHSRVVDWLRENGRYLSPNGGGDELLALTSYLRNGIAVQVVLGSIALAALSLLTVIRALVGWNTDLETQVFSKLTGFLWWSPYLLLAAGVVVVVAVPLGWAYWASPRDHPVPGFAGCVAQFLPAASIAASAATLAGVAYRVGRGSGASGAATPLLRFLGWTVAASVAVTIMVLVYALLSHRTTSHWKIMRNRLSILLRNTIIVVAALTAIGLVDSFGQTLYVWATSGPIGPGPGLASVTGLAVVFAGARKLANLAPKKVGIAPTLPVSVLSGLCALVLLGAGLSVTSALVHAVAWAGGVPSNDPWSQLLGAARRVGEPAMSPGVSLLFFVSLAALVAIAPDVKFINLSSHLSLYAGRLTRSYLGASNPQRWEKGNQRITETIEGDDLPYPTYSPERGGGPLHLVNVTVNQTVDGESQIEQRDRKGLPMAVGPHGVSVGARHHALWTDDDQGKPDFERHHVRQGEEITAVLAGAPPGQASSAPAPASPPFHLLAANALTDGSRRIEGLSLGEWCAISGAAFSTGLGSRTSIAFSALLALLNVRLGYWWDSRIRPHDRVEQALPSVPERVARRLSSFFPVQSHLLQELLARFHGPGRQRWYLTDGGHFENTAVYELIRRRVPFIVACDCGQDEEYAFEDLSALVRKARNDFGAEIRFLDGAAIDNCLKMADGKPNPKLRALIGTLEEIQPTKAANFPVAVSNVHATIAEVTFHDHGSGADTTRILFIKPTLCPGLPRDVVHYKATHDPFPQETTVDQYFDEAQWESYRKLGQHIGDQLFADSDGQRIVGLC
jgi:hypothetical protein